jgi:hypothetical protein
MAADATLCNRKFPIGKIEATDLSDESFAVRAVARAAPAASPLLRTEPPGQVAPSHPPHTLPASRSSSGLYSPREMASWSFPIDRHRTALLHTFWRGSSLEFIPNTAPPALLIQMAERNEISKMLFQRISADTRQFDHIADRDAPMLPSEFHNL